jgi:DNA-binding transcriptional ArsR family regulator
MLAGMGDGEPGDVRQIDDIRALTALSNPDRARLMDALAVHGASTTSFLAAALGLASGSISHHLRVLVEAGLVRSAPEAAVDKRERRWALVTRGMSWSSSAFTQSAAAKAAARSAEGALLARQFEAARRWIDSAEPPWSDAAYAGHVWLRLSPQELTELGAEIDKLLLTWRRREIPEDGSGRRTVMGVVRLFPAEP